jgi:hypothetical protein
MRHANARDIGRWITTPPPVLSVAVRFPLYEAAAAHEAVERGDTVGIAVIECAK